MRPDTLGVPAGERVVVVERRDQCQQLGCPGCRRRIDLGQLQSTGELLGGTGAQRHREPRRHPVGEHERQLQQRGEREHPPRQSIGADQHHRRGAEQADPPQHSPRQARGVTGRAATARPTRRGRQRSAWRTRPGGCTPTPADVRATIAAAVVWALDVDGCWKYVPQIDESILEEAFWLEDWVLDRRNLILRYGMDFFIADAIETGSGKPFAEFFLTDRDNQAKGMVRLNLERL